MRVYSAWRKAYKAKGDVRAAQQQNYSIPLFIHKSAHHL